MGTTNAMPIKVGYWVAWDGHSGRIEIVDYRRSVVEVHDPDSGLFWSISIIDLYMGKEGRRPPLFAPTRRALEAKIDAPLLAPLIARPPDKLLERVDGMMEIVRDVRRTLDAELAVLRKKPRYDADGKPITATKLLTDILKGRPRPVHISTFYRYERRIRENRGGQIEIASSLISVAKGRTKMTSAQYHLADTFITQFYADRDMPLSPTATHEVMAGTIQRTGGLWVDPNLCTDVPENLVYELIDHHVPMEAILANDEKRRVLSPIAVPSGRWFRNYAKWMADQPDHAEDILRARWGEEMENHRRSFDMFVNRAQAPLQYIFADHYLCDAFSVDEETRSKLDRLWVTLLIDAYTRSIVGYALRYESPGILSIQGALKHGIWPKDSHTKLGIEGAWIQYGIPQMVFLDNAWAHHSHSLEHLASDIGCGDRYPDMTPVIRPPYKGLYGALIERFFGNLSRRIKEELAGSIASSDRKAVRNAAKAACLLYEDIDRYLEGRL